MTSAPAPLPPTDWLVDPSTAYLNHGGFGALPAVVAAAAERWRREVEANPTDLLMRRWPELLGATRERLAGFLGGRREDLVFVPNATAGTATVISSLGLGAEDEIVLTDHRYPAVAQQLDVLTRRRGVVVRQAHVPLDVAMAGDVVGAVMAAVGPRTRLVVVDHVASPTGFVFPVAAVAAAVHDAGVPVLVDAAHAPGQVDVDLAAIGADFWVGNLHKWLCTPRACAVLHVAPRWQDRVRPLVPSHDYAGGYQPAFDWTGTLDPVPLLATGAALEFWESLGWDAVRRHQHALASDGAEKVAAALGTHVAVAEQFTAAMRIAALPRPLGQDEANGLSARLTVEHRVTAYFPSHDGTTYARLSGQLYNRAEDYERLAAVLPDML